MLTNPPNRPDSLKRLGMLWSTSHWEYQMVDSGQVGSKMVKLRVDMRVHTEKFQFFNVKYHAITEIVECKSGRVAKKLLSASWLCEYAGTRPFPMLDVAYM